MAEERPEDDGEDKTNTQTPHPPPPKKHRPLKKKTTDPPDLSNCHSCGLRFPLNLQTLDSQWRIVLLCRDCLALIRTAAACSYCFAEIQSDSESFLDCHRCSARVHVSCIPHQRGYLLQSDLDPNSFTCIDCSALPRCQFRKSNSCTSLFPSSVSLEEFVRDVSSVAEKKADLAAKAKEKALTKAEVARNAAVLARDAIDAFFVANEEKPVRSADPALVVVDDEELALQLHLAMNGSQRISRSSRAESKKVPNSYKKVEFCTEDKAFFESADWSCSVGKKQKKESDIPVLMKEENGGCSEKIVNSGRDENGVGPVPVSCQNVAQLGIVVALEAVSKTPQMNRCNLPDRYVKKYSKRKLSSKGTMNRTETKLVPCQQISCSTTSNLSDSPYQYNVVPIHSSPYSSLPGCQS